MARQLAPDESRIVQRLLEELRHRFTVFNGMQLSEGTPDTAFTLDTAEDLAMVDLLLDLLGCEPGKDVPPPLRELHADLKDRAPKLAEKIEPLAVAEAARWR